MEVEARVSVQAMRGRFEQRHENSPLATPLGQKSNTSPVRTRSSSVINKDTPNSNEGKAVQRKMIHPTEGSEQERKLPAVEKNGPAKDPKNGSFLCDIVSPVLSGSKNTIALSQRKHSIDFSRERREQAEVKMYETPTYSSLNKSAGEKLGMCSAELKPSVVKRIPVFKSVDTGLNSEGKKFSKDEEEESVSESHEKRGRFFGHIRSRSHGNFIIKRDSSVEKNSHSVEKGESIMKQKENVLNKDWLIQRRKLKSSDNLFNSQDSKSKSSFEGKQKIVANVVKNMKNKERPKVLRKLSFSSKIEKELKNKKEKAINPNSKDRHVRLPLPSPDKSKKADNFHVKHETSIRDGQVDVRRKSVVDDKHTSPKMRKTSPISGAAVATVAIAKAVADVALKKVGTVTSDTIESVSSSSSGDTLAVPPARPPRRRSSGAGLTPHKKGKAPSPPVQPSVSPASLNKVCEKSTVKNNTASEVLYSSSITNTEIPLEHRQSPDAVLNRHTESPELYRSSESLLSSQSFDKSRENSPIMTNQDSSPPVGKKTTDHSSVHGLRNEQNDNSCEEKNKIFKSELQSIHLETSRETGMSSEEKRYEKNCITLSKSNECLHEEITNNSILENTEKVKTECLPAGPPPRKPPRTFAYDIYKNVKGSKGEEVQGEETSELLKDFQSESPQPQPIYAVPVKKKKTSNKFIPKPPVRSKSDLTNKDISKPSIAPKPAHILNKAKRASVVDPLSSTEKDEEAAITSEFQRQAHIRYSLRRPKKPPPAPPPYSDMEGNTLHDSVNNPSFANISAKSNTDVSFSMNSHRKQDVLSSSKNTLDLNSNSQESNCYENCSQESLDLKRIPHSKSLSSSQGIPVSDYEDLKSPALTLRATSCSTYNLEATSPLLENDQPLSLGYCSVDSPIPDVTDLYKKRSMSDETLYKGSRHGDEPIYATPIFTTSKGSSSHSRQRELHYMCSVLFTDEEEADAGRDGIECGRRNRRNSTNSKDKMLGTDAADGSKGRSSLISAWKRDFRQSCRQVQNKIKKTVIR